VLPDAAMGYAASMLRLCCEGIGYSVPIPVTDVTHLYPQAFLPSDGTSQKSLPQSDPRKLIVEEVPLARCRLGRLAGVLRARRCCLTSGGGGR
jgi:hypothetical protein